MTIRDKTRKILWGRSGNRCAICKHELILDETQVDDESVIGDECHIISEKPSGPRFETGFSLRKINEYGNFILLCRIHHKMIDDQADTYTTNILHAMKKNHEKWVSEKLSDKNKSTPLKVRRINKNIPTHLIRLSAGKDVFNIIDSACGYSFDHDELENQTEVDLIGSFLQTIQDWGDIGSELEASDRVRVGFELTESLKELEEAGFFVFGEREIQVLDGGEGGPSNWPVAIIRVLRKSNQSIIKVDLENTKIKKCLTKNSS